MQFQLIMIYHYIYHYNGNYDYDEDEDNNFDEYDQQICKYHDLVNIISVDHFVSQDQSTPPQSRR